MTEIDPNDGFDVATSIRDRYNPTDIIYAHLLCISRLSDHLYDEKNSNYNAYNYKNMIEMLWAMMADIVDDEAEEELADLKKEYSGGTGTTDVIKYSTKMLQVFMKLITRQGMWFKKQTSVSI